MIEPAPPVKILFFTSYPFVKRAGLPPYARPFSLSAAPPRWFSAKWPMTGLLPEWGMTRELIDLVKAGEPWESLYLDRVAETAEAVLEELPNRAILIAWTAKPAECFRWPLMRWLDATYFDTIRLAASAPRWDDEAPAERVAGRLIVMEWDGEDGVQEAPYAPLNRALSQIFRERRRAQKAREILEREERKEAPAAPAKRAKRAKKRPTMSKAKRRALLDAYGTGDSEAPLFGDTDET